jgi:predicted transcriptional regulator
MSFPDPFEQEKKVLELELRKRVYLAVKRFAGSHFREIQRRSGLATGTVQHHLRALAKHGLVREIRQGRSSLYVPRELPTGNERTLGALRQASIRKILLFLLIQEPRNHEQIVRFVRLSPSTVSWHLKALQVRGLVGAQKKGRNTIYRITVGKEELRNLLITYQESFFDTLVDRVVEMWNLE